MVTVAVLMLASPLYAAPIDLISQGSGGWDYATVTDLAGTGDFFDDLNNNFGYFGWDSVNYVSTWSTNQNAAFGNTTDPNSFISLWLTAQGLYLPSQTLWNTQSALILKKTFTIADPSLLSDINLSVASDNGFVVWVNPDASHNNEVLSGLDTGFTSYWEYNKAGSYSDFYLKAGTNTLWAVAIDDLIDYGPTDATFFDLELTANAVPVPTTIILFVTGLAAHFGIKRRTA